MNITERCELCETPLEFEDNGQRLRFTKHDAAFCHTMTKYRIDILKSVMQDQARWNAEREVSLRRRVQHLRDVLRAVLAHHAAGMDAETVEMIKQAL